VRVLRQEKLELCAIKRA